MPDTTYHPSETELVQRQFDALDARVSMLEAAALQTAPFVVNAQRDLNTVYEMPGRPTLVVYTFNLSVVAVLLTLTSVQVDLLSDDENPPTTVRGSVSLGLTANGVGLALTQSQLQTITYLVPPGHNCLLQTSGTGTATLVAQVEAIL